MKQNIIFVLLLLFGCTFCADKESLDHILYAIDTVDHHLITAREDTDASLIRLKKKIEKQGNSPEGLAMVKRAEILKINTAKVLKTVDSLKKALIQGIGIDEKTNKLKDVYATFDWTNGYQKQLAYILDDYVAFLNSSYKDLLHENFKFEPISKAMVPAKMMRSLYGNVYVVSLVLQLTNITSDIVRYEQEVLKKMGAGELINAIRFDIIDKKRSFSQPNIKGNELKRTVREPLSTFSIDVDKASYSLLRKSIEKNEGLNNTDFRTEELVNYFYYDYPKPTGDSPLALYTELSACPWNKESQLLHIGLQAKDIPATTLPTSNFVFLIDVSGSMNTPDKLPLLKDAFKIIVRQLRPEDRVAIVVYAGAAGLVLPSTSASEQGKIIAGFENLHAGGSTAGGEGIALAYRVALQNFMPHGNNRVILATDGDFNVGISNPADLQSLIEQQRKTGIYLTCLGFGMGNFRDEVLEKLANKGNGNYGYIDSFSEAEKFLKREYRGTLFAVAKDVKLQVEFNPAFVESYRLIGYENRRLANTDFEDDTKDAGEIGAGHTVTALYEIIPAKHTKQQNVMPQSKYHTTILDKDAFENNELGNIQIRYKPLKSEQSSLLAYPLPNKFVSFDTSTADFQFASAVAWLGLRLNYPEEFKDKNTLPAIKALAQRSQGIDRDGLRKDFLSLLDKMR